LNALASRVAALAEFTSITQILISRDPRVLHLRLQVNGLSAHFSANTNRVSWDLYTYRWSYMRTAGVLSTHRRRTPARDEADSWRVRDDVSERGRRR